MARMTERAGASLPPLGNPGSRKHASYLDMEDRSDRAEARMGVWPVKDLAELNESTEDQERTSPSPDALSQDESDVPCMPSSFSRSLQKAEALFRTRLNPGLRWLLSQRSEDGGSDPESEDSSIVCRNLTSRSSHLLEQLERHALDPSWQRAAVAARRGADGRHCALLRGLLEDRARLLFLHEFACRYRAAAAFVARLAGLLEGAGPDAGGGRGQRRRCSLRALCEELRVHSGHWGCLRAKARADRWLPRASFWSSATLGGARRSLTLLALQALALAGEILRGALEDLARAGPDEVSADVLEDTLAGLEAFNHVLHERGVPPGSRPQGVPLSGAALLHVLAEHRGREAARLLHRWATSEGGPLPTSLGHAPSRPEWEEFDWSGLLDPRSFPTRPAEALPTRPSPLPAFLKRDAEFSESVLRALLLSPGLLGPCVPGRPTPGRPRTAEASPGPSMPGGGAPEAKRSKSVQWRDAGRPVASAALLARYRHALWTEFGRALLALLYHPPASCMLGSLNQCTDWAVFLLVAELHNACRQVSPPVECEGLLKDLCMQIICKTAFGRWDEVLCVSLGTGTKDKCVPDSEGGGAAVRTPTAELLLQLLPPLYTTLCCLERSGGSSELLDQRTLHTLQTSLMSRAVVTVQSATFWVMSKAYQFLCSWALNKFLLVTLGDLKVLKVEMESLAGRVEALVRDGGGVLLPADWRASQLARGVADLQVFSELVLRIFSKDCKKMAVEIFEQTMPSGKHWRITCKAELPSSPSDYAASAARSVIGQVLEGVRVLPDEAQIPALTGAMTAFMEAWMEHILKQKIKFSLQGALQLKRDFDLIRDLIRSEDYRLSEEIHRRLLSLQVFHQMDSAIVCLLQQPVAKPYMPSRGWERFRRCCPNSSSLVDPGSGSLNSLESMDIQAARNQALTEAEESLAPRLLTASPPESYLAISQQEWLALRIHSGTRWKLPGLLCLSKSD